MKGKYKEIDGDLIQLAKQGYFDVIAHGCNCFCVMGSGIAPLFAKEFGCDKYPLESPAYKGDINKLGQIEYKTKNYLAQPNERAIKKFDLTVVNCYTQYRYGANHKDGIAKPFDYEAFTIICRKLNQTFKGLKIGLPMIGSGLGGGDWVEISEIIKRELKDCLVTIIKYKNL